MKYLILLPMLFLYALSYGQNQTAKAPENNTMKETTTMKTYVIERNIPGAGDLTPEQLKGISQTSCSVLEEMGPTIEWQHSYVTNDKVYCVYKAENKQLIEEHAKKGNFPANSINEIATTISPKTATQ